MAQKKKHWVSLQHTKTQSPRDNKRNLFRNKVEVKCKNAKRGSDWKKQHLCRLMVWGKEKARNQGEEMLQWLKWKDEELDKDSQSKLRKVATVWAQIPGFLHRFLSPTQSLWWLTNTNYTEPSAPAQSWPLIQGSSCWGSNAKSDVIGRNWGGTVSMWSWFLRGHAIRLYLKHHLHGRYLILLKFKARTGLVML